MGAFKWAIQNGLKMIEFDVWMTKDDKLIVTHGGDNGEMHFEQKAKNLKNSEKLAENKEITYIFDHTFDEI